jgi:cytochrome o ubiquinol oxidase operon protein cyoD
MGSKQQLIEIQKKWHGSLKSYLIGFLLSALLTGASYSLVLANLLQGEALIYSLIGLAILQAAAQVIFFLHLGKEAKPYWETHMFLFMLLVLAIVVAGTLWIMYDLNHRVMSEMSKMVETSTQGKKQ